MLHKLPFEVSEALQRETDVHRTSYANHTSKGIAYAYPTADDYCRKYAESPDGAQLESLVREATDPRDLCRRPLRRQRAHLLLQRILRHAARHVGFTAIRSVPMLRYLQPESYFKYLSANSQGQASIRLRRVYYRFISLMCRAGLFGQPLLALLKQASLVQTNFLGSKRNG